MENNILKHIDYIVSLAGLDSNRLTTTRIIKFLYLLEILYLKHENSRLTDWNWRFWDFGPYCGETIAALKEAQKAGFIDCDNIQSQFTDGDEYQLFDYPRGKYLYPKDIERHVEELEQDVPVMIKMGIRKLIKKYARDTNALLDYVYFQTEPMKAANPRENLDFSLVSRYVNPSPVHIKVPKKKEKKAKDLIRKIKESMLKDKESTLVISSKYLNEDYFEGMRVLDNIDQDEFIEDTGYASIKSIKSA